MCCGWDYYLLVIDRRHKLKRHIQESCKKKGSEIEEELNAKGRVCLVDGITSPAIFMIWAVHSK
jgi:hypothetical protein